MQNPQVVERYEQAVEELMQNGGVLWKVAQKYGLPSDKLRARFIKKTGINYTTYLKQHPELRANHRWRRQPNPELQFWMKCLKEEPLLVFADVARELGLTRERVRQIYEEFYGVREVVRRCRYDRYRNGVFVPEDQWPEPLKLFTKTLSPVLYVKRPVSVTKWFIVKTLDGRVFIFAAGEKIYTFLGGHEYFLFPLRKGFRKVLKLTGSSKKNLVLACKLEKTWHFCDFGGEEVDFLKDKKFILIPVWMVKRWQKLGEAKLPQNNPEKSAFNKNKKGGLL